MAEQDSSGSMAAREQESTQPTPQNGSQVAPAAPIAPTAPTPNATPSMSVMGAVSRPRVENEAAEKPIPVTNPAITPAAAVALKPATSKPDEAPAPTPRLVRRPAVVRCRGVLCNPGKREIVTFNMGREFHPERIVLHHLCVRGLLVEDIKVRREGSTDGGVSKLDGEGELIGEAFIASITENHTPDLGVIEKNGAVDLHVKNVAPTPVMIHGHILGFVFAVP